MTAWTKDAPTAPGRHHWWRLNDEQSPYEWHAIFHEGDGIVYALGRRMTAEELGGEWWPEPIPSPEEIAALRDAAKIMGDGMRDLRDRLAAERAKVEAWQRVAEEMRDELISIVAGEVDVAALVYDAAVARHLGGIGA